MNFVNMLRGEEIVKRLRLIKTVAADTMLGIVIFLAMSTMALFAAEETPSGAGEDAEAK